MSAERQAAPTRFADLVEDYSPVHMDAAFAKARGFHGRLAHGLLLGSLVSRMVGMYLPGENAVLHSLQIKFLHPVLEGDRIQVSAQVDQLSPATQSAVASFQIRLAGTADVRATGRVQIGITR